MSSEVRPLPNHRSDAKAHPFHQQEQPGSSTSRAREHAARVFAPEDVLFTSPVVQGPFVDTSASDPLQPAQVEVAGVEVVLGEAEQADAAKWNEERIERRLRGEYERAGRQLSELVSRIASLLLRISIAKIDRLYRFTIILIPRCGLTPSVSLEPHRLGHRSFPPSWLPTSRLSLQLPTCLPAVTPTYHRLKLSAVSSARPEKSAACSRSSTSSRRLMPVSRPRPVCWPRPRTSISY